jgi:hypothetical protein
MMSKITKFMKLLPLLYFTFACSSLSQLNNLVLSHSLNKKNNSDSGIQNSYNIIIISMQYIENDVLFEKV